MSYYLGLELKKDTVAWAVTDKNYNVIRKHGKSMWGVRQFTEALDASERRTFRCSRRRLQRRNDRLNTLQELFADEVMKVDPGFFHRMKESRYVAEDKRDLNGEIPALPYSLFADKNYTDKDYHKEFPTIYHLRKYLMETEETPDIRLIYLALHHLMKHRGHFWFEGDVKSVKDFKLSFKKLLEVMENEELAFHIYFDEEKDMQFVEDLLKNKELNKSEKKKQIISGLKAKTECEKAILTLITGGTARLSHVFGQKELDDSDKPKISFSDSSYTDYSVLLEDILGDKFIVIDTAKAVYDWSVLTELLKETDSISYAKVQTFEKHKEDLQKLKAFAKKYLSKEEQKALFSVSEKGIANYSSYIGMAKVGNKKLELKDKKCSREDFYAYLTKQVLAKAPDCDEKEDMLMEIALETFLPKQVTKENSVIPYQIHLYELEAIIKNLEDRVEVLAREKDKLLQLFKFRIPYYVGPINIVRDENDPKFTWAVRLSNEKAYPWNFDEVIDLEASAEAFIQRMTNKCTYLPKEDVLPKDSLIYSRFTVLNELNNLRIDGTKISVELKQDIYNDLFLEKKRVTDKVLRNYLVSKGIARKNVKISGFSDDFKNTLGSYHDFREKLSEVTLSDEEKEQIVVDVVLFGENKKLLKQRVSKRHPAFSEKQLNAICTMSFKDWGRLSRSFLEDIKAPNPVTGEVWNIMDALWETNDNLMQLLSSSYLFAEAVAERMEKKSTQITHKILEELYVSNSVRKQIWQTVQIVKEIQKIMGEAPKRIFLNMEGSEQGNDTRILRKFQLLDLYKAYKKDARKWADEINDTPVHEFRRNKLYLYYLQKGKCMYSGEDIALDDLWDDDKYDIDHIYPQSKVMDNRIDNLVLVKKELNECKSDDFPVNKEIQEKMLEFWEELLDNGLLSKEKHERLTRTDGFEVEELAAFVQKQVTVKKHSVKETMAILKRMLPNTDVLFAKKDVTSDFCQKFNLMRVKDINDITAAKDAYINIVTGNTYFVKFTENPAYFIMNHPGRSYNLQKMFTRYDVKNDEEVAWVAEYKDKEGSIATVRHFMAKNDVLVTRKSYEATGKFYDLNLLKKGNGQAVIKGSDERVSDIAKYGGYNSVKGAYFMLVESLDKKGNKMRTIEFVPIYLKSRIEKDKEFALQYLRKERGLINPTIRLEKILMDSLFEVDGFRMCLSGRSNDTIRFKGANQLILPEKVQKTMKKVLKFVENASKFKNFKITAADRIEDEELLEAYDTFLDKLQNTVYKKRLSSQIPALIHGRDAFVNLEKEDKCKVLFEILHLFQCNSKMTNLTLIGGKAVVGVLSLNYNISKVENIKIINQSITGCYEKRIDLKTV